MKPKQFIREYGVEKARKVVEGAHSWADVLLVPTGEYYSICIQPDDADEFVSVEDLKRLVESVDLVNSLGGLKAARSEAHKDCFVYNQPLLAAIAAYESIYGGGDD